MHDNAATEPLNGRTKENSESCVQVEHKMPLHARSVLVALNWLINF